MTAPAIGAAEDGRALAVAYGPRVRTVLEDSILPFWERTLDERNGGVFNCWNNAGTELVSRDKFTWSQGRFAWLWSRLAGLAARGRIRGDATSFLRQAEKTADFLQAHAFLPDGRCAFLLTEAGELREAFPGAGPAPSIYADCFVVMGLAEFARVGGGRAPLDVAWRLFEHLEERIAAGGFPTHPEPIPTGYDSHAVAMITLNVSLVLREACAALGDPRAAAADARTLRAAERIFNRFMLPDGRIAEHRPHEAGADDTRLGRHLNPGHALEGLWMLLTVAQQAGRRDWLERAHRAVEYALERGWDETHGGLLHYVDADGGPPTGRAGSSVYESNLLATWDTKLWWVHSEALYASALSFHLSGRPAMRAWFERLWEYTLRVFPHPDPGVGEWIQIRDRKGNPLERVVALPVKDPYHIARNLIQLIELFSPSPAGPKP